LADTILAGLRDNLLLRASVATVAGVVLLGVASGALPLTCFVGLSACETGPVTADLSAPKIVPNGKSVSGGEGVKTVAAIAPPTLTRNDVVGATFAMLKVDLSSFTGDDGELKTRKVKTVSIGPDGQPTGFATPTPLEAAPAVTTTATVSRQATATTPRTASKPAARVVAGGTPSVAVTEHATAVASELAVKPPPAGSHQAVIKNSGANIRSAPSKSKSKVLFSLAGGTTVTIGANDHGWLKVTDAKGRSGWVYEELLVRE
jgi:hypothetical protein